MRQDADGNWSEEELQGDPSCVGRTAVWEMCYPKPADQLALTPEERKDYEAYCAKRHAQEAAS